MSDCRCGHELGMHGFPDDTGVVIKFRGVPCAWGHVWPTNEEPKCECQTFEEGK